ncbi:MAG TPA: ATP synthase F1 subunit delta [Bryobacteraceae bacterium]
MPSALAFRYARALADVVAKTGAEIDAQTATAELGGFEQVLAGSAELKTALESPSVPPQRKRAVINRIARMVPVSDPIRRFLLVLTDHRRAALLGDVREAFEQVMDERLGIARAEVISARPLSPPQQQEIIAGLARLTGQQARARFRVEDGLIGGVVARLGSTVYDGSIRGQLDAIRQRLAGTGS